MELKNPTLRAKKIRRESKYSPHSYEVTKIEMLDLKPSISLAPTPEMDKPLNVGLAKLLQRVEKSYASGKKKLDESQKLQQTLHGWASSPKAFLRD